MGLQDLERILSNFFEGIFARGSRQIQPVEIARTLVREMSQQRRVSVSRVYVPNLFTVSLGRADFERTAPLQKAFACELEDYLRGKAGEKGYTLIARPVVTFQEDRSLGIGEVEAEAVFGPPEEGFLPEESGTREEKNEAAVDRTMIFSREDLTEPRPEKELFLVVVKGPDQGRSLAINQGQRYLIGRKSSNNLILSDINSSREHAAVEYREGSLYLSDLSSRNGTYVNGVRLREEYRLEGGDQIQIGENILQIEGG